MIALLLVIAYWHTLSSDFEANCKSPFLERRAASCEAAPRVTSTPGDDVRPLHAGMLSSLFSVHGSALVPPPAEVERQVMEAQW